MGTVIDGDRASALCARPRWPPRRRSAACLDRPAVPAADAGFSQSAGHRAKPLPHFALRCYARRARRFRFLSKGRAAAARSSSRARHAPARSAAGPAAVHGQLRRARRRPARGRALRPRARRVHRRGRRAGGTLRGGGWRHAVPRRSRRAVAARPGQAAARAAGWGGAPRRREHAAPRRRARRGGDQPPARRGSRGRTGFAPTCASGSTSSASSCRRCASAPRTSRRWRRTSGPRPQRGSARPRRWPPRRSSTLARYDWPGNVRELQNVIASLAVHAPRRGRDRPRGAPGPHRESAAARRDDVRGGAARVRAAVRPQPRSRTPAASESRAARTLGVSRQGLAKMMRRLRIDDRVESKPRVNGFVGANCGRPRWLDLFEQLVERRWRIRSAPCTRARPRSQRSLTMNASSVGERRGGAFVPRRPREGSLRRASRDRPTRTAIAARRRGSGSSPASAM